MSGLSGLKNIQVIILGLCIALATVFSTVILSKGMLQLKKFSQEVIDITGSAEKMITSDQVVWQARFSRRSREMITAFDLLKRDAVAVKEYLIAKGIPEKDIIIPQIETLVLYKKNEKGGDTNDIEAYILTQGIEVRSADVSKVTEVSRQSTELIEKGLEFISQSPQYFYTKLAELKLEMLAQATRDAKNRAEQMAQSTGTRIGVMRSANMGVFQITPSNSVEVSDYGINDTTSLEKKVTAVVHVTFAIGQ